MEFTTDANTGTNFVCCIRNSSSDPLLAIARIQWVGETMTKAVDELRQTMPNGRGFTDTVRVILARERNWVRWKNEMCAPFDKPPWTSEVEEEENGAGGDKKRKRVVGLEEATRPAREAMGVDSPEWPHALGSEALTEIWERGDLGALTEKAK